MDDHADGDVRRRPCTTYVLPPAAILAMMTSFFFRFTGSVVCTSGSLTAMNKPETRVENAKQRWRLDIVRRLLRLIT